MSNYHLLFVNLGQPISGIDNWNLQKLEPRDQNPVARIQLQASDVERRSEWEDNLNYAQQQTKQG